MTAAERLRQARTLLQGPGGQHRRELVLLGLPVVFESNSPEVMAAVAAAFGAPDASAAARWAQRLEWWSQPLDWRAQRRQPCLSVRVHVQGVDCARPGKLEHRPARAGRLLVISPDAVGISDPGRRTAAASIAPAMLADRERFRYDLLEALTWALLTRFDRQPLHAAGLVAGGTALLLAGGSGTGKSTLSYAAWRAGIGVLGEDVVYLQSQPRPRVWGFPREIRLRPDCAAAATEPGGSATPVARNGKRGVPLAPAPARWLQFADRCVICVLGERRERAELRRISGSEAIARMDLDAPGFDLFSASIRPVLRHFTADGAWLLHPERDPDAALRLLQPLLDAAPRHRRARLVAGATTLSPAQGVPGCS